MIKNSPVIIEIFIINQNNNNRNNRNTDIQVYNREIYFRLCSIQLDNQILLKQAHELVLELEILKSDISLFNGMYIDFEGGSERRIVIPMQCML